MANDFNTQAKEFRICYQKAFLTTKFLEHSEHEPNTISDRQNFSLISMIFVILPPAIFSHLSFFYLL